MSLPHTMRASLEVRPALAWGTLRCRARYFFSRNQDHQGRDGRPVFFFSQSSRLHVVCWREAARPTLTTVILSYTCGAYFLFGRRFVTPLPRKQHSSATICRPARRRLSSRPASTSAGLKLMLMMECRCSRTRTRTRTRTTRPRPRWSRRSQCLARLPGTNQPRPVTTQSRAAIQVLRSAATRIRSGARRARAALIRLAPPRLLLHRPPPEAKCWQTQASKPPASFPPAMRRRSSRSSQSLRRRSRSQSSQRLRRRRRSQSSQSLRHRRRRVRPRRLPPDPVAAQPARALEVVAAEERGRSSPAPSQRRKWRWSACAPHPPPRDRGRDRAPTRPRPLRTQVL